MKKGILFISSLLILCNTAFSQQRISIQGSSFYKDGKPFFLIGANTPWDNWDDFGGKYNPQFWEDEFARLEACGINSSRVWISCDAEGQPKIDTEGYAQPASEQFWHDLDDMIQKAEKHHIYIIATISSFDNLDNTKKASENWMMMLSCTQKIKQYCDVFLKPLVERYKNNPYFFAIDICNEPEWMNEHKKYGGLEWEYMQMFVGMCAAAIHSYDSPIFVSVGSAAVKWSCDKFEGNKWSDKALKEITMDSLAYMDFWQIHYYEWTNQFSNPFKETPEFWGLSDKPCIIGETPGNTEVYGFPITYEEIYSLPYQLGYAGVYPWTSNGAGVGNFGTLQTFGPGAKSFAESLQKKNKKIQK